jgi:Uma2 family endonuclease
MGAPELIVEVAASSASIDLNDKMDAYARNGVGEYLVWRTLEKRFDWFLLENENYFVVRPMPAGCSAAGPSLVSCWMCARCWQWTRRKF